MSDFRVSLRPISDVDTDNIIKWRNSDFVRKNFIYQKDLTKETHNSWLNDMVKTGRVAQFIISDDQGNDIGSVYLRDIDYVNSKAEFGIFIGEQSAAGKGFGTEAAKQILDFAFKKLELNKVFLRVLNNNKAAIRSYEKVGFELEGIFKQDVFIDNSFCDVVFMAILNKNI